MPLRASGVSRRHVEMTSTPDGVTFRDLGSTNGTFLNGKEVESGKFEAGDTLQIGTVTLVSEEKSTEVLFAGKGSKGFELSSLMELRYAPPGPAGGKADLGVEQIVSMVNRLLARRKEGLHWDTLTRMFREAMKASAAKCYEIRGDQAAVKGVSGDFPDARIGIDEILFCSRNNHPSAYVRRDPGHPPVGLMVLPCPIGSARILFAGVFDAPHDPLPSNQEVLPFFAVMLRLLLGWAGEIEDRGKDVLSLEQKIEELRDGQLGVNSGVEPILGEDATLRKALEMADRAASTDLSVLVTGPTGSGKDLLARRIHQMSPRCEGPFVAVNCSAIPEALLESELFGVEKGAFTGADKNRKGLFDSAQGGTLFLDEICDMPVFLQPKLLRVLEEKAVTPLGGRRRRVVDVRVLAATNRDIHEACRNGSFREDLYYRLAGMVLQLPPLVQRGEDIGMLARVFLDRANRETGRNVRGFTEGALRLLRKHPWPGNVRQLLSAVRRLVLVADLPFITEDLVREHLSQDGPDSGFVQTLIQGGTWENARKAFEREFFKRRLEEHRGSMSELSRELGIARPNLYAKLKKLGLAQA
ncbi:MAG: sigma 54-interacting transcriptional regulator [Acidobacteriota bacterium]